MPHDPYSPSFSRIVTGNPVHSPRRFVERFPGLVGLNGLVVHGVLVFSLEDVAEHRSGVAVRRILLTWLESHFAHRRTCALPVQLFDDVRLGQISRLHVALPGVLGQGRPADTDRDADGEREPRTKVPIDTLVLVGVLIDVNAFGFAQKRNSTENTPRTFVHDPDTKA